MKKKLGYCGLLGSIPMLLSACSPIGEKSASLSLVYGFTAILSLLLLISYCFLTQGKHSWLLLLFAAVFVVNTGYYTLSVSQTLSEALLSNRISYLGSVFLPLSMLMAILDSCKIKCPCWLKGLLVGLALLVFLVAASPGYLDIYYRSVTLVQIDGISLLQKEYGPWHALYLFYLLGYFGTMLYFIFYSAKKHRMTYTYQALFLLAAVGVNLCVWLLGQLVRIDFEFLSISYIISELFLLILSLLIQKNHTSEPGAEAAPAPVLTSETLQPSDDVQNSLYPANAFPHWEENLLRLTHTERAIYDFYLEGKSTRQIMEALNIRENTLKFHNKNLYGKLGVSSRKQLLEAALSFNRKNTSK